MTKTRMEAFSDGVFAIVITLLILDIRLPEVNYANLPHALVETLPRIAAYVMSFAVIGLYWVTHHRSCELISKVDGAILWLNALLLLLVSFLPFPTSLLGRYPFQPIPIVMYGLTLLACNAVGFATLAYVWHRPHLHSAEYGGRKNIWRQVPVYAGTNAAYLLAVLLAWVAPLASYILLLLTMVVLIVRIVLYGPDQVRERHTA